MLENKQYFPFILSNGTDGVLINYSGSMECNSGHLHTEQHQGAICAWYKTTHRSYHKILLPVLQSSYTLLACGGEAYEVGKFNQTFNPKTATLNTLIEATDFKINIETFLTKENILVEHYTLLDIPKDKPEISLNLNPPEVPWSNGYYKFASEINNKLSFNSHEKTLKYDYEIYGIKGQGIMFTDYENVREGKFRNGKKLHLSNIKKGQSFTKYVVVIDEKDTPNYQEEIRNRLAEIKSNGYNKILETHQKEWETYQGQSHINIPDKRLEYLYYLSLYVIRAHQNPKIGMISLCNYPVLWAGGSVNTWDAVFPTKAILGANRLEESEKLFEGYQKVLPLARAYAKEMSMKGAYFAWTTNYEGKSTDFISPREIPDIEKANNGCLVMSVWDFYLYTGDKEILKKHFNLIEEVCEFLMSSVVEEKEDIAYIKEGEGADESIHRKNDTTHVITTIKSFEAYIEAVKILNKKIDDSYQRVLEKLKKGLKTNYLGKILLPFHGATRVGTGCFVYYLLNFPEGVTSETVEKGLIDCQGTLGLTNPGTYQNQIWPWAENKAAATLALMKDKRAYEHLSNGAKYTSTLGAFPEKIRPDGFVINYWYVSCHGSYAMALNNMIANSRNNELRILPAIPDIWKDLEIKNLRIPPGILVSLVLKRGKIQKLVLENTGSQNIEVKLDIPIKYLQAKHSKTVKKPITIPSRHSWSIK
ncbi:MAG: hypothetical protein A2539_05210 [Elusimicrobia bacterium RIFOXYD2_FULL_34_15]|nr:MAG: hypothetical protein A2539_05210 [Elusimicrobia bacterium RIFOXYD2_FULL_34_15]